MEAKEVTLSRAGATGSFCLGYVYLGLVSKYVLSPVYFPSASLSSSWGQSMEKILQPTWRIWLLLKWLRQKENLLAAVTEKRRGF